MSTCPIHTRFFDDLCPECRKEYNELKGLEQENLMTQTNGSDNHGSDIEYRIGITRNLPKNEQKNCTQSF